MGAGREFALDPARTPTDPTLTYSSSGMSLAGQGAYADFRALTQAITSVADRLSADYDITLRGQNLGPNVLPHEYFVAEQYQQQRVLDAERTAGRNHATFAAFLAGLPRQLQQDQTRNIRRRAWNRLKGKFLERLCLLSVLDAFPRPPRRQTVPLAGRTKVPVLSSDGVPQFVWVQPIIHLTTSGLRAKPDVVVATSETDLNAATVVSIRESKHVPLSAQLIRAEFGKAFDLRVPSYVLVSYYPVPVTTCDAARRLGLDVVSLGLGADEMAQAAEEEPLPPDQFSERINEAAARQSFAGVLNEAAETSEKKTDLVRRSDHNERTSRE